MDFGTVVAVSNTIATLQVVSNPVLSRNTTNNDSPIAPVLFDNLKSLNADLVRYAAWYPYPRVGVAELEPPNATSRTTSWNFGEDLQQMFLDVWNAVVNVDNSSNNNRLVVTFSTQPAWMFNTTDWSYPKSDNTGVADFHYGKRGGPGSNNKWIPSTTKLVADYYARFASWLVHGEFLDEFGNRVAGGPALGVGDGGITHWEVFNEPEGEHGLTAHQYNLLYDAIVIAIRNAVDPNHTITFFGPALESHKQWDRWRTFLDPQQHQIEARDAVANGYASFHFYAQTKSRTDANSWASDVWPQLETFLREVKSISDLGDQLNPTTRLAINEAGVIPPGDNNQDSEDLPPIYFNMVAAFYTVLWAELSVQNVVDLLGSSQYCGCPAMPERNIPDRMYPGVSMTNWTTGNGNPRYWALKLINRYSYSKARSRSNGAGGDRIVRLTLREEGKDTATSSSSSGRESTRSSSSIYVQGRITTDSKEILILVNKSNQQQTVRFTDSNSSADDTEYHVSVVDETTHDGPWKKFVITSTSVRPFLVLRPFAVAVVEIHDSSSTRSSSENNKDNNTNTNTGIRGGDAAIPDAGTTSTSTTERRHARVVHILHSNGNVDTGTAQE